MELLITIQGTKVPTEKKQRFLAAVSSGGLAVGIRQRTAHHQVQSNRTSSLTLRGPSMDASTDIQTGRNFKQARIQLSPL